MENSLDAIAGGKAQYRDVLAKAHERLQGELAVR
jgi:DNA topoisomerase IA